MRGERRDAPNGRDGSSRSRIEALSVPIIVLLGVFSIVVRSADSSGQFRIDKRRVLGELKRKIAEATPRDAVGSPDLLLREVREVVRKGDSFGSILRRVGVLSDEEIVRWVANSKGHHSLSKLQPDHAFTFLLPSGTDRLAGLQYEISSSSMLVMRDGGDRIMSEVERLPRISDVRVASGAIDSNLYVAASRRGVPDTVISAIVDIFGFEIDFTSDLRPGDTFRVAWEENVGGTGMVEVGKVLGVELSVAGKRLEAVWFEAGDDGGNYYSADGRPFGRAYLRFPVEFTRISSSFTGRRFHPVLGVNRPHLGIDFAAPIGTPVRAIAAGRVTHAGWKGGSGRYIKIDHGAGIETSYSHLKSIARGVKRGGRVELGQVIGGVGASGLATGPHLHFALYRNGVYTNPMTAKLPAAPTLPPKYMAEFARTRDEVLLELATAPIERGEDLSELASIGPISNRN